MARKKRANLPSANTLEYRRLRKNILARMRYREKQGFKVDYTTKPEIKSSATKRDVERLMKMTVGLNKYGEVIVDKPRSKAFERTDFRGITPSAKYNQTTEPDTMHRRQKQLDVDYEGMIWGMTSVLRDKSMLVTYEDIGHQVNDMVLNALMNAYGEVYREVCDVLNENEQKYTEEKRNEYYKSRWEDISSEFAKIIEFTPSNDTQVREVGKNIVWVLQMP